jgi:hypothetical protein
MSPNESPSTDVVIASYGEDLRWMSWLPDSWRHFVYCTKADRTDLPDGAVILPNVAREAGQYLHHLATRYDELADITLFLQGFPFDHNAPAVIRTLLNKELPHPICYLGANPPMGPMHKPHFDQAKAILRKGCDVIGKEEIGDVIPFSVGAQFYVRREVVHAYPREYYQRLLDACSEPDTQPGFAHMMEGNWGSVFDWKKFTK